MYNKIMVLILIVVLIVLTVSCSKRDVTPDEMIFVEGGTFEVQNWDGFPSDYLVTLSSFYIGRYEVTQAEYEAVMNNNPSYFAENPQRPVEGVTWFDAVEYCNRFSIKEGLSPVYSYNIYGTDPDNWPSDWKEDSNNHINVAFDWSADGYRLPTEMEWMFAARGGNKSKGYVFSGSDRVRRVAWFENS